MLIGVKMKVTIRYNTFETNSSSYHTVTISEKPTNLRYTLLEDMKQILLDGNFRRDCIGSTGCYSTTAITNYEKANMILAILVSDIERYVDEKLDYSGTKEEKMECALNSPYVKILMNAINRRVDAPIEIRFVDTYNFVDHAIYDEDSSLDDFLNLPEVEEIDDVDLTPCIDKMEELIFNDSIDLKIDYETND